MIQIGPHRLASRVVLAPMAGVTDQPFRTLCKRFGAGMVVSEMLTSDSRLWHSRKSSQRMIHRSEAEPRSVQIAGSDPAMMAEAARLNVAKGAQIIDINMGCPAKKVCKKAAGSALLKDEVLVKAILTAVVGAVDVPVTLKIRTGWSPDQRNGMTIARIAEDCGIQALAVHGRTRSCAFTGAVEYDTIAAIKKTVAIPVFANGDIDSAAKAKQILDYTGADGVMIGRAAQGQPWLFAQINHYLETGQLLPAPSLHTIGELVHEHVTALHRYYGELQGLRIARKHLGWTLQYVDRRNSTTDVFRQHFNQLDTAAAQCAAIEHFFDHLHTEDIAA